MQFEFKLYKETENQSTTIEIDQSRTAEIVELRECRSKLK